MTTLLTAILFVVMAHAETHHDAIMMNKKQWSNGISYEHSQWKNDWEETLKRDNENIGKFTSQAAMFIPIMASLTT